MTSIVVPIYNVAAYLDECLTSLARQTRRDFEAILVDDGSTDDSSRIAAEFAAADPRFRLVTQENKGLGAARNTGVDHASGDYLMFFDSDDVLPPYTLEVLISALEQTGSDFAAGNAYRLDGKGLRPSPMHQGPFARTRLRTHVTRQSQLLSDRTAWNKVFRRGFWDAKGLRFPEGVLYEDTPVIVPAHVLASSVDVLQLPVYYWRAREGPDKSITQRRTEVKGFVDRVAGVDWVSRFLADHDQAKLKRWYDASALRGDLMLFMRVLPEADDEFRDVFLERANDFLDRVAPGVPESLPSSLRLQWHLVRERKLPELLEVVRSRRERHPVPVVRRGFTRYHALPFFDDRRLALPREIFQAGRATARTVVHQVTLDDARLGIRGHGFIKGSRAARPLDTMRMFWLSGPGGRRSIPVVARPRRCPDATIESDLPTCSYDWSGFDIDLSLRALRDREGRWIEGDWTVAVAVAARGQASRGSLKVGQDPRLLALDPVYLDEWTRIRPASVRGTLALKIERVVVRATGFRVADDVLEIEGDLPGPTPPGAALRLSRVPGVPWREFPVHSDDHRFVVRIPLSDLPGEPFMPVIGEWGDRWLVELVGDDPDTVHRVMVTNRSVDFRQVTGDREVRAQATPDGYLELASLRPGPVVTRVTWHPGGRLELHGELPALGAEAFGDLEIVLRVWGRKEQRAFPAEVSGTTWRVLIDPLRVPSFAGVVELRTGKWDLMSRHAGSPVGTVEQLPFAGVALGQLPATGAAAHREFVLRRGRDERTVVEVGPDLEDAERGVYGRARLRDRIYPAARQAPLRDVVLYNSFTGRQYSDSPRAIHQELVARGVPLEHRWVVVDGQVALPETAQAVRISGRDWYEAYATSRYIVTNQHLPEWFRRREGQVVVQTWHGTPLKRIAHDIADVRFADPKYLENLAVETPNWTVLLSPNRFSTPILRRAFRFEGELFESGYPRNDVLRRGSEATAAQVRAVLGLPAGKKVVLYAPTWRDDEYYGAGRYRLQLQLDLDRAAAALGDDHVLLVRSHPNVADEIPQAGGGFVWDVSRYPDIADLLATTDILVTDYSSVMFDFANTGRPILFFTYDLAHYRDKLRGFYFDFEAEAPGPLLGTSDEVIDAVRNIDAVTRRYRDAYRAFAERACDLDDGHATARVVDRMLALAATGS